MFSLELGEKNYKIERMSQGFLVNNRNVAENHLLRWLSCGVRAADEWRYMFQENDVPEKILLAQQPEVTFYKVHDRIRVLDGQEEFFLTAEQLMAFQAQAYTFFQKMYPTNLRYDTLDPIYFSLFLYEHLPDLISAEMDSVEIDQLRLLRCNGPSVPITESESYKALVRGTPGDVYTPFPSNHVIDSGYARLQKMVRSIQTSSYPRGNQYIILYNDDFYVRDGQHRAAVIRYFYGNQTIPVMRLHFKKEIGQ